MLAKDLRAKNPDELKGELVELRKEQFNLRMQNATGQLGNPARFRQVRKEIARINTVLNEKVRDKS